MSTLKRKRLNGEISSRKGITAPGRLLTLPRELRDQIYEYVFANKEVVLGIYGVRMVQRQYTDYNIGIVLANKQLHEETIKLYYLLSEFQGKNIRQLKRLLCRCVRPGIDSSQRKTVTWKFRAHTTEQGRKRYMEGFARDESLSITIFKTTAYETWAHVKLQN